MTMPWPAADARLQPLLQPLSEPLAQAHRRLPMVGRPALTLGRVRGWREVSEGCVVLDEGFLLEGQAHPDEPPGPWALDRWRRLLSSILEGTVLAALGEGRGPQWVAEGLAVAVADEAVPGAGLALPDLAQARMGDLHASPRSGVAVLRAADSGDGSVWVRGCQAWVDGVSVDQLLEAAARILSPAGVGPVADAPRAAAVDVPVDLGPWQMVRVEVPAHPRGGRVLVEGEGAVASPWAPGGQPLKTVAVSGAEGCRLLPSAGGPVGRWEVKSASGWGRVFGSRGVVFDLRPSGQLRVVFADAFVGGVEAVELASRMGSSGVATGRWEVGGEHCFRLRDVRSDAVTVHGRGASAPSFAVPDTGAGLLAGVQAMADQDWSWEAQGEDRMIWRGSIGGSPMVLHLARDRPDG